MVHLNLERFLKHFLIIYDVFSRLFILAHNELIVFIRFRFFEEFDTPQMVSVYHVFVNPSDLVYAVLAVYTVTENFNMPSYFSDENVSSSLENQTDAEVWIVFFFLQTSLYQLCLKSNCYFLLGRQAVTHDFQNAYLTHYDLLLVYEVFLQIIVFFDGSLEAQSNLFALLDNLLP